MALKNYLEKGKKLCYSLDMGGSLYVFEGIDHVGKTTIVNLVKDKLISNGYSAMSLSFPGKTERTLGGLVYDIHHNISHYFDDINLLSLQMLHIAAHIDNIQSIIVPNLNDNKIILLDRFWWSTYAYGIGDSLDKYYLHKIIEIEEELLKNIAIKKIFLIERTSKEIDYTIEKESLIVQTYNELSSKCDICEKIQNNHTIESVVNKIFKKIQESL